MVERARRRAAIAFKCSADQISTTARPAQGLSYQPTMMQFTSQGNVQIAVKSSKPADAFDVSGCGQKGILVCVWANRSVRTPDTTYENTADRLCLWADALLPRGG
jgi:hypothetical protein